MTTTLDVATTILQQLGGQRFIAMTGSKGFLGDKNSLQFRLVKNPSTATHCRITLNERDLYDVKFIRCHGTKLSDIESFTDLYADQLASIFTATTKLYTTL